MSRAGGRLGGLAAFITAIAPCLSGFAVPHLQVSESTKSVIAVSPAIRPGSTLSMIKNVILIVMENKDWADIQSNPRAPFINGLLRRPDVAYATHYYGPTPSHGNGLHPSEPNYIWLEAGTNTFPDHTFTTDCDPGPTDCSAGRSNQTNSHLHLSRLLTTAGISWKTYQEDLPSSGSPCGSASSGLYVAKHNPFVFFRDVIDAAAPRTSYCASHIRPLSELTNDLSSGALPRYSLITPNLCHDMHGAPLCPHTDLIQVGDSWLAHIFPTILGSAPYQRGRVAVVLTWDEGETSHGALNDGPLGMIILSRWAARGAHGQRYDHSSTLKTIQAILGVRPLLGDTRLAATHDLSSMFRRSAQVLPCSASSPPTATASTRSINIPTTGMYYPWSRVRMRAQPAGQYYVRVDHGCPVSMGNLDLMPMNRWAWLNNVHGPGQDPISVRLRAGMHTFQLIRTETGLQIGDLLLTPDANCVPTDNGANCLSHSRVSASARRGSQFPCSPAQWDRVHNPLRLTMIIPCVTIDGRVTTGAADVDGDMVMQLVPDPAFRSYLGYKALNGRKSREKFLIVEVVCQHPPGQGEGEDHANQYQVDSSKLVCEGYQNRVRIPNIHPPSPILKNAAHVRISGSYVLDSHPTVREYHHEIHPASQITTLQ